jgi:hypothetical protein
VIRSPDGVEGELKDRSIVVRVLARFEFTGRHFANALQFLDIGPCQFNDDAEFVHSLDLHLSFLSCLVC